MHTDILLFHASVVPMAHRKIKVDNFSDWEYQMSQELKRVASVFVARSDKLKGEKFQKSICNSP